MKNRTGTVVYSYDDVKKLLPHSGTIGMWCFHANCHEGHIRCAEATQHCDCVVGILFNNMAEEHIFMTGATTLKTFPVLSSDIEVLKKYSDICLILTGDYFPIKDYWELIQKEFYEAFPIECLKEKGILEDQIEFNALLHAVSMRVIIHGIYEIHFDYQAQCGKDRFRTVGYVDYVYDRWGVKIDLIDSVRDEYGNSISTTISGLPKTIKDRINKPLLLNSFTSIEEVENNINKIEGLKVLNFYRMNGWIHATFKFDGYKPWTEGVRCK